MVIGNGLVAKAFNTYKNDNNIVIFASGVSNSSTATAADFERETNLLEETLMQYPHQLLVYFSTCSVYDPLLAESNYVRHKKAMELHLLDKHPQTLIFRVSNLAGHTTNPHTILNYLSNHIKKETPFILWKNSERNIIDIDDAFQLCHTIIQKQDATQRIYDIANIHNYSVKAIVHELEDTLGKKGEYTIVDKESYPIIPLTGMQPYTNHLNSIFTQDYLHKVIQKYYRL